MLHCLLQAQNETNVIFVPRAVQVVEEALMLGEIIISGPQAAAEADSAPVVTRGRALPGDVSAAAVQVHPEGPGDGAAAATLEDIDMKSWSAMSSQKRSKVDL